MGENKQHKGNQEGIQRLDQIGGGNVGCIQVGKAFMRDFSQENHGKSGVGFGRANNKEQE